MPGQSYLSGRLRPGSDRRCEQQQHEFKGGWRKADVKDLEFRLCKRECGMSEVRWK